MFYCNRNRSRFAEKLIANKSISKGTLMKALDKKITLFSLVWPIFLENLFRMLLGNVNVLMLSHYSDQAVGAVGVANQIISMVLTLYTIVSLGTGIIISQYLGARDTASASKAAVCSLMVNAALGFLLSIFLAVFSRSLLRLMNLPDELMEYAMQYMWIVGGASFLQALIATMSSIVRSHHYFFHVGHQPPLVLPAGYPFPSGFAGHMVCLCR